MQSYNIEQASGGWILRFYDSSPLATPDTYRTNTHVFTDFETLIGYLRLQVVGTQGIATVGEKA